MEGVEKFEIRVIFLGQFVYNLGYERKTDGFIHRRIFLRKWAELAFIYIIPALVYTILQISIKLYKCD